jgi:hypothetical protein
MSRVFLWLVRRGEQERPVRIHLDHMGEWVLTPAPASDREVIRADAQTALPTIQQALAAEDFFATHEELDVPVDTFHPRASAAGQLAWDPVSTPYLVE